MVSLFIGGPMLQSCGSSRGCKKMRKYRKYTLITNPIKQQQWQNQIT
jgi:hypothetical protein